MARNSSVTVPADPSGHSHKPRRRACGLSCCGVSKPPTPSWCRGHVLASRASWVQGLVFESVGEALGVGLLDLVCPAGSISLEFEYPVRVRKRVGMEVGCMGANLPGMELGLAPGSRERSMSLIVIPGIMGQLPSPGSQRPVGSRRTNPAANLHLWPLVRSELVCRCRE